MEISRFTVRVYGLLVNPQQEVLLVHEKMPGMEFTKFPGGGLEFGEGTRDCLAREFKEETGMDVAVGEHLYTTDFFQQSAFRNTDQLLAVYYRVKPLNNVYEIEPKERVITIGSKTEYLRFYWRALAAFNLDELSFPVDRIVARKFLSAPC